MINQYNHDKCVVDSEIFFALEPIGLLISSHANRLTHNDHIHTSLMVYTFGCGIGFEKNINSFAETVLLKNFQMKYILDDICIIIIISCNNIEFTKSRKAFSD